MTKSFDNIPGSNLFEKVLNHAQEVEESLLGPSYPYYKNSKSPSELRISDKETIKQMDKDVDGLIKYVEVLVTGKSAASATGGPLGNNFLLQTGDNVPAGNQGLGVTFSEFKGLMSGAMGNLNVLNPFAIIKAFLSPPGQSVTMQVIDVNNDSSSQSNYVTLSDVGNINACTVPNNKNQVTGKTGKESFQSINPAKLPGDSIDQIYFICLAIICIYILYRCMEKSN
jgi:hypothetical protein